MNVYDHSKANPARGLIVGLLTILCTLVAFVHSSFAQDFTSRYLGDYGNVTVMEVSGNFDEVLPDGSENVAARQNITKEFFRLHKDEYDSVVIFTGFDYSMRPDGRIAFYSHVKNDVQNIGLSIFDYSSLYGSNGRLHGTIDMGNVLKLATNPLDPGFNFSTDILVHEMLHRWGAYIKFKDWNGSVSNALLGYQASHWSFLLDSGGSTHLGNKWQDNGDGTFTSTAVRTYYSPLDLYLMGMIDKSKVPPTLLIENPAIDPTDLSELGKTISGTPHYVNIDDIIAVEGERSPGAKDAQKEFKTAFVYAVRPGSFNSDDLYGIENLRNAFLTRFSILTDGKGLVQVNSTLKEDIPTNPGVRPPASVPRTLPPNIDDGRNWLVSQQKSDGSWTDVSLTSERDTAEAVTTLQIFPATQQQFQKGLLWLKDNVSSNTDYLARRTEATLKSGGDAGILLQELLSRRNLDGGWGSGWSFISNPSDTALVLKALASTYVIDHQVISNGISYLQRTQAADGGWNSGDSVSTIQPTANVLSVLSFYRNNYSLENNITAAITFLAGKQNSDGGFGNSPSTVYDSASALLALVDAKAEKATISKALGYLNGQQGEDSSWGESPYQTAIALRALWLAKVDPDLAISASDISFIPERVTALPTTAVMSAVVWNLGRTDVPKCTVSLYEGGMATGRKLAEQTVAFPGMSPTTVTFSFPVTDGNGHYLQVVLDPDGQVYESDKSNNSAAKAFLPESTYDFGVVTGDLAVSQNAVDINNDVTITTRITNRGTSDAYNVQARFFIDEPGAPYDISTVNVDIPAGGSVTKQIVWKASKGGANLPLTVQIDPLNLFSELTKENNKASIPLTVKEGLPNLSISYKDIVINPSPAREAGNANISVLVKNDGFVPANDVKVNFYRGVPGQNESLIGSQVIPVILPGQRVRTAVDWVGINEAGTKIVSIQVDPANTIAELNKNDNVAFLEQDILSLPELAVSTSAISINPTAPREGDPLSINVTVQNSGAQEAANVLVEANENGATIGRQVITLIQGSSTAIATIPYATAGRLGSHTIEITVDPENAIFEKNKDNNRSTRSFTIQNASLWLSEPFISPDGDGVKDSTDFFFRLTAPAQVTVKVVNGKGETVRTFAGGELNNTSGTTVSWNGLNDDGSLVADGEYQVMVASAGNAVLGSLPVTVDTNRLPLTDAIGTKYLLQSNITCMLPDYNNWSWLPHDSGILFSNYASTPEYPAGGYTMSPAGDDVRKITPDDWSDGSFDYYVDSFSSSVSPDGSRIAFVVWKQEKSTGRYLNGLWTQGFDGAGLKQLVNGLTDYIYDMKWSPDSRTLAFTYGSFNFQGYWLYELRMVDAETGAMRYLDEISALKDTAWSPDGLKLVYPVNVSCNEDKSSCSLTNGLIRVTDLAGSKRDVHTALNGTSSYSNIRWLADGMLLAEENPGNGTPRLELINMVMPANPLIIANKTEYPSADVPVYAINPDGKSIAFVTEQNTSPYPTWTVKVVDLEGTVNTVGSMGIVAKACNDCNDPMKTISFLWSRDGRKLAYVERALREADNKIYESLVVYDRYSGTSSRNTIAVNEVPVPYTYSEYDVPHQLNRLIAWMEDKQSILVDTAGGFFAVNTATGTRSANLPIMRGYQDPQAGFSPDQHYITYYQAVDPFSTCAKQWGQDIWTISSLLNLTADLRIVKDKSALLLKGTAADRNFGGYLLEYADAQNPAVWVQIAPPSDVPVVNDLFTLWIPPYEGTYYVRLTVWDKAGNKTETRSRVSWGLSSSIVGLYKSLDIFSPNGDGIRDTVELNYRVLEPVHLEFTIRDSEGHTVRTYTKTHIEPTSDYISWDGRNEAGVVVPDGKYTMQVFDYEFTVELDATPPDTTFTRSWQTVSHPFLLFGHAYDGNLKQWSIEYGEGENPQEWHQFRNGQEPLVNRDELGNFILKPKISDVVMYRYDDNSHRWFNDDDILWTVGKKFRITAEDFAGNVTSRATDLTEERLVFKGWELLGGSNSNGMDYELKPGPHKFSGFETVRNELSLVKLQYRLNGVWHDSGAYLQNPSGKISLYWDTTGVNKGTDALRLLAYGINGVEYLSEEKMIVPELSSAPPPDCPTRFVIDPGRAACGTISGKAEFGVYPPNFGGEFCRIPIIGSVRFYIEKNGTWQLYSEYFGGKSKEIDEQNSQSDSIDTRTMPEGIYHMKAEVVFSDIRPHRDNDKFPMTVEYTNNLVVDRVMPVAQLKAPVAGQLVCPIGISNGRYAVKVEGLAADNTYVNDYSVQFGLGENPDQWNDALTEVGPKIKWPGQQVPLADYGPVNGSIGYWKVTELLGKKVSLKLKVMDIAGNTSCDAPTFTIRAPIQIDLFTVDKTVFASNRDILTISYTIKDDAAISAKLLREDGSLAAIIFNDRQHPGGSDRVVWDGRGANGDAVPDGRYKIVLDGKDPCGFNVYREIWIEIDNSPPETSITYPKSNDPLPPVNIFEVKGTASDPHFNNYTLEVGEGTAPGGWTRLASNRNPVKNGILGTWNTFGLQGAWTIRLRAEDTVGNSSSTTSTIDLGVRKTIIKNFDATPKLFSPNGDQKLDSVLVTGEVTDACQLKFEVLDGTGNVLRSFETSTAAAGVASFSWDGRTEKGLQVADGPYPVKLTAALSSRPEVTQSETITLTVDSTPPAIVISDPPDKSYLNKAEVILAGSITDPNLVNYSISVNGPAGMTALDSGTQNRTSYTFGRMADLAEDTYTVTVDAKDQGENATKVMRLFTIDRTPPKVTLDTPKPDDYFGNTKNVIDITGAIVEKNLAHYSIRYGAGETPTEWKEIAGSDMLPAVPQLTFWKVGKNDGVADGVYTLSLYAKDKAGLEGETKLKLVVDNTPPQIAITSPKEGDYVTKPLDILGTVADPNLDKGILELAEGNCATAFKWSQIRPYTAPVNGGVLESWKLLPADGDYCLRLSAADKVGNQSETKVSIKIDTHPPAAPQLSGKTQNKTDDVLSWSKSGEPDLAGYNLYRDGMRLNTAIISDTTFSDAGLNEGSYSYVVKAVDFAGNESIASNSVKLRIDLTGPTVRISTPGNGTVVSNLIDIKGTAFSQDDFKEYRVSIGQGNGPSNWTVIRRSPLPISYGSLAQWDTVISQDGAQFTIRLEGEDISGNISTAMATVTIDNTPPKAPVLLTAAGNGVDVALTWKVNTEPDLAGYLLYRNDQLANVNGIVAGNLKPYLVAGTGYTDKSLADGTYRYYLVAMDQAGNTSDQSNTLEVAIDTHPPHMTITEPVNGLKFEARQMVKAETPDTDVATVQFQYKRAQDAVWTNVGSLITKPPYVTYFDPKVMGLPYGDFQLQAVAVDRGGKVDPAPTPVTVIYTDLTPPDVPTGLAAKVRGAEVNLTWNAVSEAGGGYNVYRWVDGARSKVNSTLINSASYVDAGVPDGLYQYEITSVDIPGNESTASEKVPARIYAPVINQPFSPVKEPALTLVGNGVDPNASVTITIGLPSGDATTVMVLADATGNFKLEGITLAIGENRFTAVVTDSLGNVSKPSDTIFVAYGKAPAVPTGLIANVQGKDVTLNWDANSEPDILGYYIYRDGTRLMSWHEVQPNQASASSEDMPAVNAIDNHSDTFWSSSYSSDGTFTPVWWQMILPSPELVNRVYLNWMTELDFQGNQILYAGRDFEVQAWSGHNWVTIKKVTGNDQPSNTLLFDTPYRTDRLRLLITATTDPNASKQVKLVDAYLFVDEINNTPSYQDINMLDGKYLYEVAAVNQYGFISDRATTNVKIGAFPQAPSGLIATVQGSDVVLNWNPNPVSGPVTYYNLQRWNGQVMEGNWWVYAGNPTFTDYGLPNGTYRYRVSALARGDINWLESDFSNDAFATVAVMPPQAPSVPSVSPLPEGKALNVMWQSAGNAVDTYGIYRGTNPAGPYTRVSSRVHSLSYIDTGLINGVPYFYVITAIDATGNESAYSGEASGIPHDLIAQRPSIFQPTVPGIPLTVHEGGVKVAGFAEPAAQVDIFRGDTVTNSTIASAQDEISDAPVSLNSEGVSLSPDEKTLAYINGANFLELQNLADSTLTTIPNAEGVRDIFTWPAPQWSPNGRYLLAQGSDYSGNNLIVLYDRDAGTMQMLTTGVTSYDYDASWSPSGDAIVFVGDGESIWMANPADGSVSRITGVANYAYGPRLSPDGSKIAFFDDYDALYVFNRTDNSFTLVDDNGGGSSAWSPDGSQLTFTSYRDGDGDIYTLDFANGTVIRRSNQQQDGYNLLWSPDGSQLGFSTWTEGNEQFWIVDINGHERMLYEADGEMSSLPKWRADGSLILIDPTLGIRRIKPAGYFSIPRLGLIQGENQLFAIERDEAGNVSPPSDSISVMFDTGSLPDLAVNGGDITIFPPYPKPGEDVLVTARVRNPTNNAVDNVAVDLYLWDGSNDVATLVSETIPHIDANGEASVSTRFNAGTVIGTRTIIAVADPANFIAEVSETNNYATKDIVVTDQERITISTLLNAAQYAANQNMYAGIRLRNTGLSKSGTLNVMVEDAAGNLVKLLGSQSLELPYGFDQGLTFAWNTVATFAGSYRLHSVISDASSVLAEDVTPFTILPDLNLSAGIVNDRQQYGARQDVGMVVSFKNIGVNYLITQLRAKVRVLGSQNTELFSSEQTAANLMPGASGMLTFAWNTALNAVGNYTAAVDIYAGDTLAANSSAGFAIMPSLNIGGSIKADPAVTLIGNSLKANFLLTNNGNADANGTASVSLVDPDTLTVVATSDLAAIIPKGSTISGSASFTTDGLMLKNYLITLRFLSPGYNTTIGSTSFSIKDGTPPVLTVTAPTEGATYTGEAGISVFAVDNASGVDKVEYSIDGGAWLPIPLADPVTGRYSAVWTPPMTGYGLHNVTFRGTDRTGNTRQSAVVNFMVQGDTIPPVLTVSILADGSVTNKTILNITGTVTDNVGVKELTINGIVVPVQADGSYSYALALLSGPNPIEVKVADLADNPASDNRTINLDQKAPKLVITAPADNSKTGEAVVTVTGNVDEASIVEVNLVKEGNVKVPQTVTMDGNNFTTDVTLDPQGNTIEVIATDMVSNTSSDKRSVFYDDQKPSVAITSPDSDIRINQESLIIKGTASDPYGLPVTVSIDMNGYTFTPEVLNGQFEQLVNFTTETTYNIIATATTKDVQVSSATQRNIIYDITQPTLAIDSVTSPTNQSSVTLSGTMEEGATVTAACATATLGTVEYPNSTSWRIPVSGLTEDTNTITITATDIAGNETVAAAEIIYDITPPIGSIYINGGAYSGVTQVNLNLSATDKYGVAQMRFSNDDGVSWTEPETYAVSRVWVLSGGDGFKQVFVQYQDKAGNWSTDPIVAAITLDTTPPAISAVPAGGIYNASQTVRLSANEDSTIYYTTDGSTPDVSSAIYTSPLTIAANTVLNSLAVDRAGNRGSRTDNYIIDTVPPSLTVSTLADDAYTNIQVLNVAGSATDSSGIKSLVINGVDTTLNQDGSFSQALVLQPGPNALTVVATDLAGNNSTDVRTINLDMTAPLLTITAPADNAKTASPIMSVTGTVNETSTVTVKLGTSVQQAAMDGAGFITSDSLIPGINTIEVTATDLAGNTSSQKRTVIYDDQKPSLAVTDPPQDIRTNQSGLILKGTASDPYTQVGVTVTMEGQSHTPQVVNDSFQQALTFTQEKSYAIVVTAANEVGSSTTTQRNVIYDTTPPSLAINPVQSPTIASSVLLSGTRETDVMVTVVCPTVTVGTIIYPTPTTWQVQVSGMSLGEHIVTAESTDAANNTSTASVRIVVQQSGADIVLTPSPHIIWPPNHKMVPVTINGVLNVPPADLKSLSITLTDEYGEYNFTNLTLGSTVLLEAWRNGDDMDGRKYTFTAVLTRKDGSKTSATAVVSVPHDMSGDGNCGDKDDDNDGDKSDDKDDDKDDGKNGDDKDDDHHHDDDHKGEIDNDSGR